MSFQRLALVTFGALTACAPQKPAVSMTTLTNASTPARPRPWRAPWVPDQAIPADLLVETPEELRAQMEAQRPTETWGVRPATQQELDEYGF